MPDALLRPCAAPLCPHLVESGYCDDHAHLARPRDEYRGSAHARGYTAQWRAFCARFRQMLVAADIAPVCGASLPGGPAMPSRCRREGRLEGRRLQVHHAPPLSKAERGNPRIVCDPLRVGLLCASCHSAETARRGGGGER